MLGDFMFRWLREPVVHFFVVGGLLFLAEGGSKDDSRTIEIMPATERDLVRQYQDAHGRAPTPAEWDTHLQKWKRDEALFREALRTHVYEDDANVRISLIDNMRARAAIRVVEREPSETQVQTWFAQHREKYATPVRYDFEWITFSSSTGDEGEAKIRILNELKQGKPVATLGREVTGGNLSVQDMAGRVPAAVSARLPQLALHTWTEVSDPAADRLWLVRVKSISGGEVPLDEVRAQVVLDLKAEIKNEAIEAVVDETVRRYRFVETSK